MSKFTKLSALGLTAVAVSGLVFSGCNTGNSGKDDNGNDSSSRELKTHETDSYVFYYPDGYEISEFLTPEDEAQGVWYELVDFTSGLNLSIDLYIEEDMPADAVLDDDMCSTLIDSELFWEDDEVINSASKSDGDVQWCEGTIKSDITGDGDYYYDDYYMYYKNGGTKIYTVRVSYDEETPDDELKVLRNAAEKFEILD
ncbi:hypothetical protein JW887_03830 [Candidatus Dojkabacteria bacterium]|nr:hypothetical protein [Candidatus Dojkabacteria bacterium]